MALEINGVADLQANLLALRTHMSGPASVNAVRAGGNVIRDALRALTPILIEKNTGSNALPPGSVRRNQRPFPQKEQLFETTAIIGPGPKTAYVARWVEYGHRMVSGGYSKLDAAGKLREAGQSADQLAESLGKDIAPVNDLLEKKNQVGFWAS